MLISNDVVVVLPLFQAKLHNSNTRNFSLSFKFENTLTILRAFYVYAILEPKKVQILQKPIFFLVHVNYSSLISAFNLLSRAPSCREHNWPNMVN
jgi:hypothetical protein